MFLLSPETRACLSGLVSPCQTPEFVCLDADLHLQHVRKQLASAACLNPFFALIRGYHWSFKAPLIEAVSLVLYQTWSSIAQPPKHQTRLLQFVSDPSFHLCHHYFHLSQPTLIQISSLALRAGTSSVHLLSFLYNTTHSLLQNLTCFSFLFSKTFAFLPETQQCHLLKTSPVGSGSLRLTTVIKEATAVHTPH